MKNLLLISSLFVFSFSAFAQNAIKKPVTANTNGYHINITYTPYKNCYLYLGSYFGNGKTLTDSAWIDAKGNGTFKGNKKLTGGIYFLVSPQMAIQFDFLIGKEQDFSIIADSSNKENITIIGSHDNTLFKQYSAYTVKKGKSLTDLNTQYNAAKTKTDSVNLRNEIIKQNKELQDYRDNIIKQNPNSLLAALLTAMKRPDAPAIPIIKGKADSTYPYRFVKEHFWDDVLFNDDRLLHTPFFEKKLDEYFKYYVFPEPDSLIKEIKIMLLSARTGKEMYPYLLTKFTNKYLNPEYMGQDKVFLYLFENFYAKGDTSFLNAQSRKMIFERAYSLMANQLGNPAPILDLTDTSGKNIALYSLQGKFTMVVFWDPTCGHCKEELPRVDSFYQNKWKPLGMKLYSVNVKDGTMDELKKFVHEKKFSADWVYTYQTKAARDAEQTAGQPNFRQLYDISKTPTLYLLDEDKRIIAKQLSIEQFDDIINAKIKNK
jgi:thiol-disulfide isomerase/thioredoxin